MLALTNSGSTGNNYIHYVKAYGQVQVLPWVLGTTLPIKSTSLLITMIALAYKDARQTIHSDYTKEERIEIANHGCESGCASTFIYTQDCLEFFTEHQEEIELFLDDHFSQRDSHYLTFFSKEAADLDALIVSMVWAFVEIVCAEDLD